MCISLLLYTIVYPSFSLFYVAKDMSTKNKAIITDRATAKKAKAYVYGVKERRKLAAVKMTNISLAKYMADNPQDLNPSYITFTSAMTVALRLTLFVFYLYMVWSFFIYDSNSNST